MHARPGNGTIAGNPPDQPVAGQSDPLAAIAQEVATYEARLPELLAHEGRFVLIKGDQVVGFFDSFDAAYREGRRRFGLVPLLVKQITAVERVVYLPHVVL